MWNYMFRSCYWEFIWFLSLARGCSPFLPLPICISLLLFFSSPALAFPTPLLSDIISMPFLRLTYETPPRPPFFNAIIRHFAFFLCFLLIHVMNGLLCRRNFAVLMELFYIILVLSFCFIYGLPKDKKNRNFVQFCIILNDKCLFEYIRIEISTWFLLYVCRFFGCSALCDVDR